MQVKIAQASLDSALAKSRAELLLQYGFAVQTFETPNAMKSACENQRFDLLIVGHSLEYPTRDEICTAFRKLNPESPILQLKAVTETIDDARANFNFSVSEGPHALVKYIEEILHTKTSSATNL